LSRSIKVLGLNADFRNLITRRSAKFWSRLCCCYGV